MADIDKVIKGFERCVSTDDCSEETCPYFKRDGDGLCWDILATDALELLKEQKHSAEQIALWNKGTPEEDGTYVVLQYWSTGDSISRNVMLVRYSAIKDGEEKCFWNIDHYTHKKKIAIQPYAWIKLPEVPE